MKEIVSVQNPFIKFVLQLQEKAKYRKQNQQFVIEGVREIELTVKGNYEINMLLFCSNLISIEKIEKLNLNFKDIISISSEVYQKIAYRDSTEGIIAVANTKNLNLKDLKLSKNPIILVAEALEKPGNLGAILRTADAAKVDAVLIANPKTDLYNPNLIRSSVGCIFTNQIICGSSTEIISLLKENNIQIFAAILQDASNYHLQNYTLPSAIVVGTEATGLTQEWRNAATQNIKIPMQGEIDSMNVSVAAAILLFEAKRQRNFITSN